MHVHKKHITIKQNRQVQHDIHCVSFAAGGNRVGVSYTVNIC